MNIRNLDYISKIPVFGPRLYEALQDIQQGVRNIAQQGNLDTSGANQAPPPQINSIRVTASGGVAHVQLADNNNIYRGVQYHVQYSTDSGFSAPITVHMGPSQDIRIPVGTQPLYYRAYSDYPTSPHSAPVYHSSVVAATGTEQPPIPSGQGSGTGTAGQISGFGPIPFRGTSPPRRQ